MNVEYQFTGIRRDNIKVPGTDIVPRIGETVLFIEDGVEVEYSVEHVYHVIEEDQISVQVVLREA
jgi:hypothetical protein